jgi:predicted nucleic acid-binding protein
MPINYTIAADIVDIHKDTPSKDDAFFIDTNVWYWMTYTKASAKSYQTHDYQKYVNSLLAAGSKAFYNGLSLAEIAHQIEKTELAIFNRSKTSLEINLKEFRHNHILERNKVVGEIETAWAQVKSMAEFLELTIDALITDSSLNRLKTQKVDGYDLFFLELMAQHHITQILTDDGDFATIPGIKMFTSNINVINAARQQNKLLNR